jgi:hypothetical protein
MILYSDEAMTPPIPLTNGCLIAGTTTKVNVKADYIGLLRKIRIYLEGNEAYRCSKFIIQTFEATFEFECVDPIKPCGPRCGVEIMVNGLIPYNVIVRTDDNTDSGTTAPIQISLFGTKGVSDNRLFSETGAKPAASTSKILNLNDLGDIIGYSLTLKMPGRWVPVLLTVENTSII